MPRNTKLVVNSHGYIYMPPRSDADVADAMWIAFISNGCKDTDLQKIATASNATAMTYRHGKVLFRLVNVLMTIDSAAMVDDKFALEFMTKKGCSFVTVWQDKAAASNPGHMHANAPASNMAQLQQSMKAFFDAAARYGEDCATGEHKTYMYDLKKFANRPKPNMNITACVQHHCDDGPGDECVDVTGLHIAVNFV